MFSLTVSKSLLFAALGKAYKPGRSHSARRPSSTSRPTKLVGVTRRVLSSGPTRLPSGRWMGLCRDFERASWRADSKTCPCRSSARVNRGCIRLCVLGMGIHTNSRARCAPWQHQAMARACHNDTTASDRAGVLSLERIPPAVTTLVRRATDPRTHAPRRRQPRPSPATIRLHSTACSSTTTINGPGQSGTIHSPANRAVLA